jgi:hypothetical protein
MRDFPNNFKVNDLKALVIKGFFFGTIAAAFYCIAQ